LLNIIANQGVQNNRILDQILYNLQLNNFLLISQNPNVPEDLRKAATERVMSMQVLVKGKNEEIFR